MATRERETLEEIEGYDRDNAFSLVWVGPYLFFLLSHRIHVKHVRDNQKRLRFFISAVIIRRKIRKYDWENALSPTHTLSLSLSYTFSRARLLRTKFSRSPNLHLLVCVRTKI